MQQTKQPIDQNDGDRLGRLYVFYYNLAENPFRSGKDPRYFWLGEEQLEALAYLKLGVEDGKGILVLTGEEGVGKSVVVDCLLRVVEFDIFAVPFDGRGAAAADFLKFLAETFRLGDIADRKGDVLAGLREFLESSHEKDRKVLLITKNAQALDREILEQARLLSNIELEGEKLMSILLIGSDRFLEVISQPDHKALMQRVAVRCRLDPLSVEDTGAYIQHRVKTAGGVRELLTPGALREIHSLTKGNPGLINIVCDHALMKGYFDRLVKIGGEVIEAYAEKAGHLLEGDRKKLSEFRIGPTQPAGGKKKAARRWWWAISLLVAVLVPFFWYTAPDLRGPFSNKDSPAALQAIYFESGATAFPGSAAKTLERVVNYLEENPGIRIRIVGHSDNVGNREVNIQVSRNRAEMVKEFLLARGVNRVQMEIDGKGPDNPVATNSTREGRRKNRRVEIEIIR